MGLTLFEKIWNRHVVADLGGGTALVLIDRILLHERTGSVALNSLADAGRTVATPAHVFATMDHIVDTLPGRGDATLMPTGRAFIEATRAASHAAGITLFDIGDPRQGIVHVISPEQGIVLPGVMLVDGTFDRADIYALEAACDCFVSLHRSEGFGLAIA